MGPIQWFLFVYVLGGLTFVPLLITTIFLVAYFTLPDLSKLPPRPPANDPASLVRNGDVSNEKLVFKTGTDDLAEKFQRKHDSDVATGYFAVCREYVPGGVNGKPPEKLSPAGEVVAQESPSVYQSMYRSIFDRSQKPTIEPNKDGVGKNVKRANNVFFVVLRHGHLMLYDDIQQLEVRYVISLEYHDVDIYGGEDEEISEAELWIKRNAIRLRRTQASIGDKATSLPFFFFSENLSEKEDFYHAILANKEKRSDDLPVPQDFDTQHIISLVQKLHSSEEQLQTRWLNALLGRLFLAMYKTPHLEHLIRQKLTKKMSRVKKPNFITKLALQKIDTGTGAPFITNPRLKDLTVNGECVAEMDIDYTGCFRIEIAATARIDLGTRFKAREVDMVLAVTCRKLSGHMLVRFKPPPSNRLWFSFEKMPKVEMTLEPIVSSRQITYTLILKAIESRIREVIAEAVVLPYWDDMPFLDTEGERYRGGVWKKEAESATSTEIKDESPEDETEAGIENAEPTIKLMKREDRNMSMPVLSVSGSSAALKAARKSVASFKDATRSTSPDRAVGKSPRPETPRVMRSSSFASAVHPAVSPTHADGQSPAWDIKAAEKRDNMLKDISLKSLGSSPEGATTSSLQAESAMAAALKGRTSSNASSTTSQHENSRTNLSRQTSDDTDVTTVGDANVAAIKGEALDNGLSRSSSKSQASSNGNGSQQHGKSLAESARSLTSTDRKQALTASALSAAQAAQRWGWGVINRGRQREADGGAGEHVSDNIRNMPMGRGQPLPPPGTPLPPPERPSLFSMPRRKPVPSPVMTGQPKRASAGELSGLNSDGRRSSPRGTPTASDMPGRRRRQASIAGLATDGAEDEVLVVEAPTESNHASPALAHHDEFFGHGEDDEVQSGGPTSIPSTENKKSLQPMSSNGQKPAATTHAGLGIIAEGTAGKTEKTAPLQNGE